jgi:flagellar biosynthesis/type III secretory pathway protein FliH
MSSLSNSAGNEPLIQEFTYPALGIGPAAVPGDPSSKSGEPGHAIKSVSEEEANARATAAHRRGLLEGQQLGRTEGAGLLERTKAAVSAALADFARQRDTYFQEIEAEVISLSLSVVRKILNREAQVDPLVLKGVVRAALERLAAGTAVRLYVPPLQAENWRRLLAAEAGLPSVEVIEDPAAGGQQCRIETDMGNTHLSVETQLKEIEQGFTDLLARAPRHRL